MSKVKKVLAIILSMAMILGMSLTTFAETKDTATITVNNAEDATLEYAPIIKADRSTSTGWAFVNPTVAQAFLSAFPGYETDQALLEYMATVASNPDTIEANYAQALSNVVKENAVTLTSMENPQSVSDAGVYMIKAKEEGYTYGYMAAFVGFGEVTIEDPEGEGDITYEYPSLVDAEVNAKKTPTTTTKTENVDDNLVEVGTIVTYTIEAYVPYFDSNDTNKTFSISDTIEGADYYFEGTGAIAKVEVAGIQGEYKDADDFILNSARNSFSINLNDLVSNGTNQYAGNKVTVTYTAKVTGTPGEDGLIDVNNTAASHVGTNEYNSDKITLYTAQIIMTKKDSEDQSKILSGAGFLIYKKEGGKNYYATFDSNNLLSGWTEVKDSATEVFTGTDGTVTVKGLDQGTYYFEEKTAPEGYSVNGTDKDAVIAITGEDGVAKDTITVNVDMLDTKLSSLPETGGIGTTIFTIGGCVIMIAAAGLYFASRRRQENK